LREGRGVGWTTGPISHPWEKEKKGREGGEEKKKQDVLTLEKNKLSISRGGKRINGQHQIQK